MKIGIRTRGINLSESLRTHIERRLRFALGRFSSRIIAVTVMLENRNGSRDGIDKHCHMTVALTCAGHLRVDVQDADILAAVDCAADRLGRTVAREIDRHHGYPQQKLATVRVTNELLFPQRSNN